MAAILAAMQTVLAPQVWAACSTSGTVTTCNTNTPNPSTATIGAGQNTAPGASVTLQPGAQISVGNANAISLGDNAVITLGNNSLVQNNATSGSGTNGNGLWNAGKNTIEFGSNGQLTIGSGAIVQSLGISNNAEAINVMGVGNVITNFGTVSSRNGAALWFEDRTTGGSNTIDNYGTITTSLGANSNVIGNNSNGNVNFINESGATVNGSLSFAGGNDTLTLFPNSVITGGFNGGGGTNALILNGALGSSDTLPGSVSNFQTLTKTGLGTWTLSGAVGNSSGNAPLAVEVQAGTLALTGNNTSFRGNVLVDAGGILEARAQSLPPTVTDNGLVRFAQDNAGSYSGVITGSGAVEKTLGGTLTLTGTSTYTGGTTVNLGEVVVSSDANLGAVSGGLTLDGGALGTAGNVTIARNVTLGDAGGTFDPMAGTLTVNGTVGGTGTLTKTGAGTLTLAAANNYSGDTIINQGTVQIASDANLGDPASRLQFNGGILATTANIITARTANLGAAGGTLQTAAGTTLTDSGAISGTGMLTKTGAGTLALTAVNTQTGGTSINGGIMIVTDDAQLGDPSAPLQFDGGTLVAGAGTATRPTVIHDGGATVQLDGDPFDQSQFLNVDGTESGTGGLTKTGTGTIFYNGDNSYAGPTTIAGGFLYINGNSAAQTGTVTAMNGTRLSGNGVIGGSVVIQDGAILGPGRLPGTPATLTINGDLNLSNNSILLYNLVEANTAGGALNDLLVVHGNLTLDGVFNVLDQGQTFGPGVYRIIDYDGTLTDNGFALGHLVTSSQVEEGPLTGFTVQTAISGQVNLINTTGLTLNYWDGDAGPKNDGVIDGGDGTWRVAGPASTFNWVGPDGTINAPWANGQFAIFAGAAGTVQVDDGQGQVQAAGMQFASDGYLVQGGPLQLVGTMAAPGATTVRVGDGTTNAVSITATIAAVLTGATTLTKTDLGTLVLTGANSYGGGTEVDGGTIRIASDANLGAGGSAVILDSGTLATTAGLTSGRNVTLNGGGGSLAPVQGTTLVLTGTISGAGGLTKADAGTVILTNTETYAGGTLVSGGTLQVGSGGTAGSITGDVTDNALLAFNRSDPVTFDGIISGTGALLQAGSGTLTLTGGSSYAGGTTIGGGSLQLGNGGTSGGITGDVADNGTLIFNRSDTVAFAGTISGSGAIVQAGAGVTVLTGDNSYAGTTQVNAGSLYVDGDQGMAAAATSVAGGATLGGTGTIGGDVAVAAGGIFTPGGNSAAPGTLTIKGTLALDPAATLNYSFGQANVVGGPFNDLTIAGGNLSLGGTLNVVQSPGGTFDPGIYRVIDYAGSRGGGTLALGTLPAGSFFVQTAVDKQVNLINATGLNLNYWDGDAGPFNSGTIEGGNGTWQAGGSINWTDRDGAINATWDNSGVFAVFQAAAGQVMVDDGGGQVRAAGMQFASDGYALNGAELQLAGAPNSIIRVGDGASDGAAYTATVNVVLSGNTVLEKADLGTLILTAANSYTGGTEIDGGTIQISSDTNLGAAGTGITLNQGTLATTADLTTARPVTLNAGGGAFRPAASTTLELDGPVAGAGSLIMNGAGTLILTAAEAYAGGTNITAGTLQVGNGGTTGSITGDVANGATLAFDRSDTTAYGGVISGSGALVQKGTGTVILTGDSSFTGTTTIASGTLQLGDGGTSGSIAGDIVDNGTLVVNRSDTLEIDGLISGTGDFVQAGPGTTILSHVRPDGHGNSYTGRTIVEQGTLQLGTGSNTGGGIDSEDIVNNSVLVLNFGVTFAFTGSVSGTGSVIADLGSNTVTVLGTNTYTGGSIIRSGTVQIGNGGTEGVILGDIANFGTLIVDHSDDFTYSGVISGTGNAIKMGPDSVTLAGENTYTGGTTIAAGTLVVGDGGTHGSILGDIEDDAVLAFDRSDSILINGMISGTGVLEQRGTGTTVLGAANSYGGGTVIAAGTLQVGNGANLGSIAGDVADNGILVFNRSNTYTFSGTVSGSGRLVQAGTGTLILTAANSYGGGTFVEGGALQIASDANMGLATGALYIGSATLSVTADIVTARPTILEEGGGTFAVPAGITLRHDGGIDGAGGLTLTGGGLMILSGANTYSGPTMVQAGTLFVNGNQSAATGLSTAAGGATLGGTGTIGGDVVIADGGTLAPGDDPGTLTINGSLALGPGSLLAYDLGRSNVIGGPLNDHAVVKGSLVLDGTLNVITTPGGSFDPGIYRIVTYAGSFTDNGLAIGTIPSPDFFVQTSVAGAVNLVNTAGLTLNFWDGAAGSKNDGLIQGGSGIWQNSGGNDNWTDINGSVNAPFTDGAFAIFQGTGGTVTVDASLGAVRAGGMQFAADGYAVQGDAIALAGADGRTVIRIGDGTLESAAFTTTVASVLSGDTTLVKADLGTLVLTAANTYTGGTAIEGGILQVASDANLGGGGLSLAGGTLATTADLSLTRTTTLDGIGGGLAPAGGTQLTMATDISGAGTLYMLGEGRLVLTGSNSYGGGTVISSGTLQLGNGGTSGSITGDVTDNAVLAFDRSDTVLFSGAIGGTGGVAQIGSGTTVLTAANSYAGSTAVNAGMLAVGDAAHPGAALNGGGMVTVTSGAVLGGYGSIAGPVSNGGTIAVADAASGFTGGGRLAIGGVLTNAGTIRLDGAVPGNVLSAGSYAGQDGHIVLNAMLDGDDAPSDRLVIQGGTASGHSTIAVINPGGQGGATPGNGILLVDAQTGATTAADAFTLDGRAVAGPYQYTLFRGGRDGSAPDSWYLRSELTNPPGPGFPPPPVEPVIPDYRAEVSLYTALPAMALDYGAALVGSLHKRVGEEQLLTGPDGETLGPSGGWLRFIGEDNQWDAQPGGIYRDGPSFHSDMLAAQGGVDLYRGRQGQMRDFAGLLFGYGHMTGSVAQFDGSFAGKDYFDSWSLGVYWTRFGAAGWYIDAVMQGVWHKARTVSDFGTGLTTRGSGALLSLEGGYPLPLGDGWTLEPQTQVIYQTLGFDDSGDSAAQVRFRDARSFLGRAGEQAVRSWTLDGGQRITGWLMGNIWNAFVSNPKTDISSADGFVPFHSDRAAPWVEIGLGVSAEIDGGLSGYATGSYQKGFDNGIRSIGGSIGLRFNN